MRIAFVFSANAVANAQYRALMPMTMLKARGHDICWVGSSAESLPVADLKSCDLIHVYRAADPALLKSLKRLQASGVKVNWDNDDDGSEIPRHSPSYRHLGGARGQRDFSQQTRAITLADLVTTTNQTLADKFEKAGARAVTVVENYLPLSSHAVSRVPLTTA